MVCASCGAENTVGRKFCDECGASLASTCPSCGSANRGGARFCGECGTALGGGVVSASLPSSATARREPAAAAATVAERRLVTVLFADLVGFTPFAEERDAEEVREALTRYFDLARDVIDRYGGVVEKFIGDAVMAVWGTPIAHEDDAERAVRAGLDLVDEVRSLGPGIQARAGLLSGEAAVNVGATDQGMVAGDLVNTAARLQSVAAPGTILVGEATMRAAAGAIAFEEAGPQILKGKASPVPAWRALRVVAQRGGSGRPDQLDPPFVGRDEEFRVLKDALHATGRDRRARLVSITGPAGIGKSRLAWEFEKYIDGVVESIYWHRGRSPSYGAGLTFWALGEMVRRRAGLAETDDETATRAGVAEILDTFVPDRGDREWIEPALLTLLGVEGAPAGGRDVLFAAWRMLFERIANAGTTVLVFEDLHWADSGLLDFIDHILEWSRGVPILIVTLARPELFERRPDWGAGKRNFTALALEPLPEADMRQLLAGLVPGLPEPAVRVIVKRADGVPLYAVETVRMLVAEGRLERDGDAFRPVGDLGELAVPESLRSLIASRLDALDPADRGLLQDAAVLGQSFGVGGLAVVTGLAEVDLEPRLRALVRRELLEIEVDPRSPERGHYSFVQALIREVAYGTLARRDRRAKHLAVARYYEAQGDEELAGGLARHYLDAYRASAEGQEAAAIAVQARIALKAAAERAVALGAHDQAVTLLEEALEVASESADQTDLLELAATSARAAGRYPSGEAFARRALALLAGGDDGAAIARATALLAMVLLGGGQAQASRDALESALDQLGDDREGEAAAAILTHLARARYRTGDYTGALEAADRALTIAERLHLEALFLEALLNRASALGYLGRHREACIVLEGTVRLAAAAGQVSTEIRARHNLANSLYEDDPRQAAAVARAGLELAEKVGVRPMAVWLATVLITDAYLAAGDWDWALRVADDLIATGLDPFDRANLIVNVLFIRADRGEPIEAAVAETDAVARERGDPQLQANVELVRATAATARGDFTTAIAAALRAVDLSPAFGVPALAGAFRAALWTNDAAQARSLLGRLEEAPGSGRSSEAERLTARAGMLALDGRLPGRGHGLPGGAAGVSRSRSHLPGGDRCRRFRPGCRGGRARRPQRRGGGPGRLRAGWRSTLRGSPGRAGQRRGRSIQPSSEAVGRPGRIGRGGLSPIRSAVKCRSGRTGALDWRRDRPLRSRRRRRPLRPRASSVPGAPCDKSCRPL